MTRRFPKEIMVKWEYPVSDEPYMTVGVDSNEMAESPGESIEICVYRIVRRAKIVCTTEVIKGRRVN